jgi:hypothetical protein
MQMRALRFSRKKITSALDATSPVRSRQHTRPASSLPGNGAGEGKRHVEGGGTAAAGGDTTERGTQEGGTRKSGRCSAEATKMSIRRRRQNRALGKIASVRSTSGIESFGPLCRLFSMEAAYNLSQTGG